MAGKLVTADCKAEGLVELSRDGVGCPNMEPIKAGLCCLDDLMN